MEQTPPRRRVSAPPETKPLLLFDGDCGFCRYWVNRWRRATGERVDYAPSQEAAEMFPEIPREQFARTVILVTPEGDVFAGAEAVCEALAFGAPVAMRRFPLWIYRHVPGAGFVAETLYGLVARHRVAFSRITRLLWGTRAGPPGYARARCLFLRLMGLVYLIAFLSLWVQIDALAGEGGILPARAFLEAVRLHRGTESYWLLPTLCWIHPGDGILHLLCGGGAMLSACVLLGLLPAPCLLLLWAFYLSLTVVCREFLGFQWDNLLLEAGFLAIFIAPLNLRCRRDCQAPAPRAAFWLLRWLLFRLMFSSGVVKLASGDPAWRSLTALTYHYETQPLPLWTSWYAHQLPAWFHALSSVVMFAIELAVPFLIFAPRRPRLAAFWTLAGLQLLILATGNYAFFNLLALALCVLLLDDEVLSGWRLVPEALRKRMRRGSRPTGPAQKSFAREAVAETGVAETGIAETALAAPGVARPGPTGAGVANTGPARAGITGAGAAAADVTHGGVAETGEGSRDAPSTLAGEARGPRDATRPSGQAGARGTAARALRRWPLAVTIPVSALVLILGLVRLSGVFGLEGAWPRPVLLLDRAASPFRTVNGYGLFAVMTTVRNEIVVEGSRDGRTWLPYEFACKPGDVNRRPSLVAPHQPRLDWQMWFAALGDYRSNPWFLEFLARLLQGSPKVLGLLAHNPFPEAPPRYVRAMLYEYHFTGRAGPAEGGAWWRREPKGVYYPPGSLSRAEHSR